MVARWVLLSGGLLFGGLLSCAPACAQVSGSLALLSDYRFRGISLSDGRPALQLSVAWEADDGWYAGALASSVRLYEHADLQLLPYAGYARRLGNGMSWEAGAEYVAFRRYSEDNYPEVYLGLASGRFSGRLYYAPRYFNADQAAVYAELNATQPLGERWRLLGHVGWLRRVAAREVDDGSGAEPHRLDARIGLGASLGGFDLQLARVASNGGGGGRYSGYPLLGDADAGAWVVSLSHPW